MPKYNVAYKGLKSTYVELNEFIGDRFLNIHDWISGFQRGLIVIKSPDSSKINESYSITGYFINHDGTPGNIQFERESKQWTEKEIREKLKRGKVLETLVELDEDKNVILKEPRCIPRYMVSVPLSTPLATVDKISLEHYLMETLGAFPRLYSKYRKDQEKLSKLYKELYGDSFFE
jgi:hypothetical protein